MPSNAPVFSKSDSLPLLKIRNHTEGILIPSVKIDRSSTRSVDDSKSFDSLGTPRSKSVSVKNAKGSSHALMHPVKVVNKREIQLELSPSPKELPKTKLDILEAYLPKSLRNDQSAARHRLKLEYETEQQRVYNLLKGEVGANGGGISGSNSIASSYNAVHYSSGDWSVAAGANALVKAESPTMQLSRASGFGIANITIPDPQAERFNTLWETPTQYGMVTREKMKAAAEAAEELAHSSEVLSAIDEQKARLERKTLMKVKLMNTMFANKIKLRDALRATALQLRPTAVLRTKKAVGVSDYAIQNEALHVDFRNLAKKPDEELDFEAIERSEMPPFLQRVLTVKNMREENSQDHQSVTTLGSISLSSDVIRNLQDLGTSQIKEKLQDLAQYINSHTSRKVIDCWHLIEGRFKSSTHSKSVTEIDANGLAHPVKHPAITISALTFMLCSAKIKVGHQELLQMTNKLGFITPDQTFHARRVAAMQVVLAMDEEIKSEYHETFKQEHWHLMKGGEPLVSLQEFIDIIFSADPEEREHQFALIRNSRQEQVQAMIEEKKTKAASKQRAAARKKQMIDDFTVALATIQLMKGILTPGKVADFLEMVEKCKVYIEKQKEDQAANVPQDLVLFLGLEAFPQLIQDLIIAKKEAREAATRARRESDASVSTAYSESNPFSKANLAKKNASIPEEEKSVTSTGSKSQLDMKALTPSITTPIDTHRTSAATQRGSMHVRIPAYKRVHLAGPPPVLDVIREMVSYGRGLQGISYREAVSVLQAVAATKINSIFRCYRKRWRYSAARRLWIKHFRHVASTNFNAMRVLVAHNVNTRKFCWRKIKAWRFYTKRTHERREAFRIAFWPFYVWHRYANAAGKAKDKATFLVGRVMPTLQTIKVFKAWKSYAQLEGVLNRTADAFNQKLVRADGAVLFRWLHSWAHKRHAIRRCWTIKGNMMRQRYFAHMILLPFYIWRVYTKYRVNARGHTKLNFHSMRRRLLPHRMPMHSKSNAERRIAMKVNDNKRKIKHRRVSQVELKDKLKKRAKAKRESTIRRSNAATTPHGAHGHNRTDSVSDSSDNESVGGGHARRRASSVRQGSMAPGAEIASDFSDAVQALFKNHDFQWNLDMTEFYDIDVDQEDEDGLTPTLLTSYRNAHIPHIQSPDVLEFYSKMHLQSRNYSELVCEFYSFADHWNCFEAAFRFHFFGRRAFSNMRYFATTRRKLKDYIALRNRRIKMQIILELRHGVEVRSKRNATVRGSEAEMLSQNVRAHQLVKVVRLRKFTADVNNALGRDHDDDVDEEHARLMRIRALNLIDPDDEKWAEKEALRLQERQLELKRQRMERDKKFTPPDLLAIDRSDRDIEHKQAEAMVAFSKMTTETTAELVRTADVISSQFREKLGRAHDMVLEVLDAESAVTSRAVEKQEAYMAQFKVHAADALIKALLKVYLEVQMSLMKEESKVYFRCLRLPMLLSRSKSMFYRKKLMNWIRICRRLNSISRKAHFYQATRTKWVIFNRWLKYIAIEKLNPTPGIVKFLARKAQLVPSFDRALREDGFEKSVYVDNERLNHATSEFKNIFSRWKMLTQEDILFRVLNDRARLLFRLRILQKCFWAMKTGLELADNMRLIRTDPTIFPIVRALADVSQVVKKFILSRRKSLSTVVRRNNRKYIKFVVKDGQSSLSFKSFINEFKANTNSRISTEQRLISDYFEIRGTQTFEDVHAPVKSHPIIPPTMARVSGKTFCDPHQITADGRSIAIPGGYKLSKVKFAFQYGFGVIGWQLFWSADGGKDLESPQRGAWHTASLSTHDFVIPKDDFLAGVEYLYDGDIMVGVRLKLFFAGFTRWLGGKTSLSTLSVYLDVSLAEREAYEDERDSGLPADQLRDPAYPYNFVIGFTGAITANRTTCLGLVVRKTIKQNLFSYTWVGDALWKLELEKSEKDAASSLPSIDLYSMPTHLSNYVTAPPVGPPLDGGDSLTMSMDTNPSQDEDVTVEDAQEEEDESEDESQSTFQASTAEDDETVESHDGSSTAQSQSQGVAVPIKPRARRMGISNPVVAKLFTRPVERPNEPLSSSEVQFFDVLRMRTTELSHARSRAMDFARNLWTNKNYRLDSTLCKLVSIRIVSGLTKWFFNAINKRLIPLATNEKAALQMLRRSRQLLDKAESVRLRVNKILANADILESSAQAWTGKHLLSPKERGQRAEHHKKVAAMRAEAAKVKRDENFLRLQAVIDEKRGLSQMPKLTLSLFVVNNYRLKLAAARHKESLLERMTLEEVKTGLFGSNLREKMLSKEQMQAIHESLRSQQLKLKDVTSLDRLIDDVVEEEGVIAQTGPKRSMLVPRKSVRQITLAVAPSLPGESTSKPSTAGSSKLTPHMALRLSDSNLINSRARSPPLMTDRVSAPPSPNRSALSSPNGKLSAREMGSRSYSFMDFNPFILPALPDKSKVSEASTDGIGANASPPKRQASPPLRSRNSTPIQAQRPPRPSATPTRATSAGVGKSGKFGSEKHGTKKAAATSKKLPSTQQRQSSRVLGDLDGDESI